VKPAALAALRDLSAEHDLPPEAPELLRGVLRVLANDATAPSTVREPAEAVDVHVRDALDGLRRPEVRAARCVADLGAGAGFPGLVLAVALPQATVRLVESVGRKCAFLSRLVAEVGLGNVEVVNARAEDWPAGLGAHDLVTARALAPLAVLAEYAAPLLRLDGHLVAWKGRVDGGRGGRRGSGRDGRGAGTPTPHRRPAASRRGRPEPLGAAQGRRDARPVPATAGMARKRPLRAPR
jgi:16S rRNA (guanine527-N7)-methyltransferase